MSVNERCELDMLVEALDYHWEKTPFWNTVIGSRENLEKIKREMQNIGDFSEASVYLINELYRRNPDIISTDNLRNSWNLFRPKDSEKKIRYYQSSASSGEAACVSIWTEKDLESLLDFLTKQLHNIYPETKSHIPKYGLIVGPYGWYQEENTKLFWNLGVTDLYFIGIETWGIKKMLIENEKKAMERVEPTMKRINQYVSRIDNEMIIRYPPLMFDVLETSVDKIRYFITSGIDIDIKTIEYISSVFTRSRIIPFYGDSIFGDAIGFIKDDKIIYMPPSNVFIFPVKKDGSSYKLCEYGERGYKALIRIGDAALYVFVDEKEIIWREEPMFGIKKDCFSNPTRKL